MWPATRRDAYESLVRMGPEAAEAVLNAYRRTQRAGRRADVTLSIFLAAFSAGVFAALALKWQVPPSRYPDPALRPQLDVLSAFAAPLLAFATAGLHGPWRLRRQALTRLIFAIDDVRLIGPLVSQGGPSLCRSPRSCMSLIGLLPRLRSEDGYLLDARQRAALRCELPWRAGNPDLMDADADFVCAILAGLAGIEDTESLPVVARIAAREARSPNMARVKTEAERCRAVLQECVERARHSSVLLRPAEAPTAAAETLLRAAASAVDEASDELLRASVQEDAVRLPDHGVPHHHATSATEQAQMATTQNE
jgi:hypothetical protein